MVVFRDAADQTGGDFLAVRSQASSEPSAGRMALRDGTSHIATRNQLLS
jgi:hypothetical protein